MSYPFSVRYCPAIGARLPLTSTITILLPFGISAVRVSRSSKGSSIRLPLSIQSFAVSIAGRTSSSTSGVPESNRSLRSAGLIVGISTFGSFSTETVSYPAWIHSGRPPRKA